MSTRQSDRGRILILIKGLGIGGAETLIAEAGRFWDRSDFEYEVAYLLPWKNQLVARLESHGVPVRCLEWSRSMDLAGIRRLRHLINETRPDLIHSHSPLAGILARTMKGSAAHVYTEHNVVDFYRQPTRVLNRVTYAANDAVIAVSDAVASSLKSYPGPTPIVIPNGVVMPEVSVDDTARARAELGITPESPLVVHVGNIRPHKGHENLIRATAVLAETNREVVVVSIGGEKNRGDLARIRETARRLGVSDRIRFLGRRPDALSFLAAADVAVNPSDVEGLPLFILEALSLGKPVVATDVGGVASVVRNGETGLLVPPGQPAELAKAISRALISPARDDWGSAGRRLIADHHGMSTMVSEYEGVYRGLLG